MRIVTAAEAMNLVSSGDRVYLHGGCATPRGLVTALAERLRELRDIEIVHLHTEAPAPYAAPEFAGHARHNALFIGPNVREAVAAGHADYTPVFLSEIPALISKEGELPIDVAIVHVSPPDEQGHCTFGPSVDVAFAAVRAARVVIAQVNPLLPRPFGSFISAGEITVGVLAEEDLTQHQPSERTAEADAIGRNVAALVRDGATLQLGIGTVPDAVLANLKGHRHLGVHTEMFSDGLVPLVEAGVVDGSKKTLHRGVVVSAFVLGTSSLYRFIDRNPKVELHPVDYTNDVQVIAANYRMTAINSALSVDLTGQVAADSIGARFYSGIGGQVDFIRGAARSIEGLPVIALPSTAAGGKVSRICPVLAPGTGVVTTRGDVHWVVTEHGAANLHGRTIRERARMLIDIAHPDFRAQLEDEAGKLGYLRP